MTMPGTPLLPLSVNADTQCPHLMGSWLCLLETLCCCDDSEDTREMRSLHSQALTLDELGPWRQQQKQKEQKPQAQPERVLLGVPTPGR